MSKDKLTSEAPIKTVEDEPRVAIRLPKHEDEESGIQVDQYEHVTINGVTTLIRRGERVEVTVPVYIQLRNKFPDI